ncbi:MAG: DUF192 domain-containing protein [Mariprofundaceae bacterium]
MTSAFEHMEKRMVSFINDRGDTERIQVRIADEVSEQSAGYQSLCYKESILPILFVFPSSVRVGFHMRNAHFPIDVAFFDDGGQLLEQTALRLDQPTYDLRQAIRYALEAPSGFLGLHHMSTAGSRLEAASLR